MTKEQLDKLYTIGKQIQEICPNMYGSVKFNLRPGRESVNVNFTNVNFANENFTVEESKILTDANK